MLAILYFDTVHRSEKFQYMCKRGDNSFLNSKYCLSTMVDFTRTVSQKNCATFIFTVTLANVGRF